MLYTLGVLLIIIGCLKALFYNKNGAQKRCSLLSGQIKKEREKFGEMISAIIQKKSQISFSEFIDKKEDAYLITKEDSQLTIFSINNNKKQTIYDYQYDKLNKKLDKQNPT